MIEATQWFESGDHPEDNRDTFDTGDGPFLGEGKVVRYYRSPALDGQDPCKYCDVIMHDHGWIDTVQGGHVVCPGDWIITDERVAAGQHGRFYVCKSDVFEATYEAVG